MALAVKFKLNLSLNFEVEGPPTRTRRSPAGHDYYAQAHAPKIPVFDVQVQLEVNWQSQDRTRGSGSLRLHNLKEAIGGFGN